MIKWRKLLESPYQALMMLRLVAMVLMLSASLFDSSIQFIVMSSILFFVVGYFFILYMKKRHWIIFLLEFVLIVMIGFYVQDINVYMPIRLLIGLVGLGLFLYYEGKLLYISWAIITIILIMIDMLIQDQELSKLLIDYSFIIFASVTGGLIRYAYLMKNRYQELYQKLENSYQKLQEYAETIEHLAIEKERNRISREIHDTVGHAVTALIFQLEAARKLIDKDYKKSTEIMKTIEDLARSIYQEIRFSIEENDISDWENLSLSTLLEEVVQEFAKMTQLKFSFQVFGEVPNRLSRDFKFSLYRILQETLTNAKRHGYAHHVAIELSCLEEQVQLVIQDNGVGADELKLGFGLTNLQKRVNEMGGECNFQTSKGSGFRTEVIIPNLKGVIAHDSDCDRR
ncbi:Signal transduction histidine kinase [Seinonella peptonophila]|uniref:histidine kinase n=1 Tax=Seinonella peptonophila TaxID=112248 RepID=A0A1M4U3G7_9BACL|nr:sensor histidine kinase [Seinonella peptonophila]SHE51215.1 Signal transduction histidine kinase [Seinonella peptonophila]